MNGNLAEKNTPACRTFRAGGWRRRRYMAGGGQSARKGFHGPPGPAAILLTAGFTAVSAMLRKRKQNRERRGAPG